MELDFEIDKITESIENAGTGETLDTIVLPITDVDMEKVTRKNGWLFDWELEFSRPQRQVYKLVTEKDPQTIHGLVSLEKKEGFVLMNLIESAPFNIGKTKKYLGVAGNLTAYGCKLSKEYGFNGVIAFDPKTALIPHYQKTLGAVLINDRRMAIFEKDAQVLLNKYFPETEAES
jgi:hypothetical protein